ncbi:MAG: YciI-like protein [Burkholderiales bacterium]
MDFLLFYDYAPDYLERRGAFRNDHLKLAWDWQSRGKLVLAGALANPADGAVFHFRADSAAEVESFVRADPYVRNGIATSWRVREWTTVVGAQAASPVHPS